MYAYCGNNPVNRIDPTGEFAIPAVLAGLALSDLVMMIVALISTFLLTDTITKNPPTLPSLSLPKFDTESKENSETKDIAPAIPKESDNPIIFPINPNDFNPVGLNKVFRDGTKNGSLISWMDPLTNTEVFRWDENPNYSDGPHYHIYSEGHYIPGVDRVPEPYASIYFPFG